MAKIRVHELAKELGMKNNDLMGVLKGLNYEVTNHMSTLDEAQVRKVKAHLAGGEEARAEAVNEKRIDKPVAGRAVVIRRRAKVEEPQAEGVHGYAAASPLEAERLGEAEHGALRRAVESRVWHAAIVEIGRAGGGFGDFGFGNLSPSLGF